MSDPSAGVFTSKKDGTMKTFDECGGAAFPCEGGDMSGLIADPGMTLRDYFAGQALAGISSMSGDRFSLSPEDEAHWAYELADAMLKARGES